MVPVAKGFFQRNCGGWRVRCKHCVGKGNGELKKFYFSFGQNHAHAYGGRTFDKDCIVVIEAKQSEDARAQMFSAFGNKWSMQYDLLPDMSFFPRGLMTL